MDDDGLPDLTDLEYDPQNFRDLYDTEIGQLLWEFMKRPDNVVRMDTATYLDRAAVEPLAPGLVRHFGEEIAQDRHKQMVGHMARQIMSALGMELYRQGMRITKESIFTTAARYHNPSTPDRNKSMQVTAEQRRSWIEKTAASPFNKWMDKEVRDAKGAFNLDRLYEMAAQYGITENYRHLNAGQQRMLIGIKLRKIVPPSTYEN